MKIYLTAINAKYIHSNPAVFSLRAYAKEYREQIEIGEYTINHQKDYILSRIYKAKPDVLCFSVYIWNLSHVISIAREFHRICPEVPIWLGGPEVSYEAEAFLKEHTWATGIMVGEGEETFRCLCSSYMGGEETTLEEIAGLVLRKGEDIVPTKSRPLLDMNTIPFLYDTTEDFSNRIIYYESSRGCPFSCSYCLSSVDKCLRFRDTEQVKKELQFFIDRKVPQIKFVDRTFNCSRAHSREIWQYLMAHDNGITNFHFEISADLLQEADLELFAAMRPGLIQLEIGVQSTNPDTIREIHRTMNLDTLKEIVGRIRRMGNIHQHLDLIAGLPEEGYDSFARSFDEIYALKPNQLQLGFLKVLKGSWMYEHAADYGLLYHSEPPYEVLQTNWLTYDEILQIRQAEEMLEVYYNSGQYEVTMKLIDAVEESMFAFFRDLGAFCERKGYDNMSHSRIRRCEILLEYLEEAGHMPDLTMIRESLLFDLYYRENCKSRPAWAPSVTAFREMTRIHCPDGKLSHLEPFHYRFPEKEVLALKELPARSEETLWALFHYDRRDPLDHQAEVTYI